MSGVLNISPLKWKLTASLYPAVLHSKGFSSTLVVVCVASLTKAAE